MPDLKITLTILLYNKHHLTIFNQPARLVFFFYQTVISQQQDQTILFRRSFNLSSFIVCNLNFV